MINIGPTRYPGPVPAWSASPPSTSAVTLNASGDKIGFIIQIPKAGTLEYFEWLAGTVSNNPDNGMRLSFQTVDPATGLPDGVVDQFFVMAGPFTSGTWQTPSGPLTDDGTGTGVKRTVTQGEYLSLVIDFSSFVAGDSIGIANIGARQVAMSSCAYVGDGSSGAYLKSDNTLLPWALRYDDDSYAQIAPVWPLTTISTVTFGSGSTPDERGLRFQLPFAARITGANLCADFDNDVDVVLYDAADNILTSISTIGLFRAVGNPSYQDIHFESDVDLAANTTYRLTVLPTTASTVSLSQWSANTNALFAATGTGVEWYLTTRTNAGAWTDTTTAQPFISLILNGLANGAVGNGIPAFPFIG